MRHPASEKLEIIRTVEGIAFAVKQTLDMLGIPRSTSTASMICSLRVVLMHCRTFTAPSKSVWNRIPDDHPRALRRVCVGP